LRSERQGTYLHCVISTISTRETSFETLLLLLLLL
jgi:hypothetical protein